MDLLLDYALSLQSRFTDTVGPNVNKYTLNKYRSLAYNRFPFNKYASFWLYATYFRTWFVSEIDENGMVFVGSCQSHYLNKDVKYMFSVRTGEYVEYERIIDMGEPYSENRRFPSFIHLLIDHIDKVHKKMI